MCELKLKHFYNLLSPTVRYSFTPPPLIVLLSKLRDKQYIPASRHISLCTQLQGKTVKQIRVRIQKIHIRNVSNITVQADCNCMM